MNNEPELKYRETLLNDFNSKNFTKLLIDIYKLQKSYPNSIFLLSLLGTINNELGNYKEAIHNFEKIIQFNPKFADAHYNLGVILKNNNQINRSIECFEKSITLNPNKFEAYNNLGNIYRDKHKTKLAIKYYLNCLEIDPDYIIALQNFGICLQNFEFSKYSKVVEKHIINLLNKNKILRTVDIIDNLIKFIYLDIENSNVINNFEKITKQITLDELIIKVLDIKILLALFKTTPITDLKIEKILRNLRYKILLNISSIKNIENALKIMGLIASQCFINEYIYPVNKEENLLLKKLERELDNNLKDNNLKNFILHITCLSSYKSLGKYSWSSKLLGIEEIRDLVNEQIVFPEKEFNIRKNLKSLEIRNSVSLKVKNQYENSPYPRWDKISLISSPSIPIDFFKKRSLNINEKKINKWENVEVLVAGCGTGQHAITTATKYKNSFVTALDLSAHSLSYAKRKADELEIKNINFIQMDLLNLKKIDKQFHIIEAVGVLHHMDKPFEGWEILYDKLDLGGLMMIGLYSEIARKHIKKIRNDIKKINIKNNKKNIINFREKIILSNDDKYKLIKQSPDFYSFSNLVDLLFHVQEHRFTIPEISNCINKLNLKFCGFENRPLVNSFYKIYKNKKDLYNLDLWNEFEINNPRIFAGMYQFWCQKI